MPSLPGTPIGTIAQLSVFEGTPWRGFAIFNRNHQNHSALGRESQKPSRSLLVLLALSLPKWPVEASFSKSPAKGRMAVE